MKVIFAKDIEPANRREIEDYLKPFAWLVPSWCKELHVKLCPSADGEMSAIKTGIRYEYRRAYMEFYSIWLNETPEAKRSHVIHDLLHIATSIYVDYAEATIKKLAHSDAMQDLLLEESRQRCEAMTEDLANVINARFK